MKIGVARNGGLFDVLPHLLNSLPAVQAKFYEPFESYDVTIGFRQDNAREIKFDPENENLENMFYPVTIPYMKPEPFRIDRGVCFSPARTIRRNESIFSNIGRLVVADNYSEVRELIHKSIPVEQNKESTGIQVILEGGYSSKVQLLSAIMKKQPFIVMNFEGLPEILRTLRCVSPWMLPCDSISDAVSRFEFMKISANIEECLEEARQKCLSERIHSRNLHLWAKVLYG